MTGKLVTFEMAGGPGLKLEVSEQVGDGLAFRPGGPAPRRMADDLYRGHRPRGWRRRSPSFVAVVQHQGVGRF